MPALATRRAARLDGGHTESSLTTNEMRLRQ